jgi:putative SOS response-associated peptidase YedK
MQRMLAVRLKPEGFRLAEPLQWGLIPGWAKDPKIAAQLVNARGETVASKPSFRSAFKRQRCLIPVSGYFEWQVINSKTKQPWHIFRADGGLLPCAGLWESWQSPDGSVLETCAIITTTPNENLAEIHDRMPVILAEEHWGLWLDPTFEDPLALTQLLVPCPNELLKKTSVSSLVNSVRNESPECLTPVKLPRSLF